MSNLQQWCQVEEISHDLNTLGSTIALVLRRMLTAGGHVTQTPSISVRCSYSITQHNICRTNSTGQLKLTLEGFVIEIIFYANAFKDKMFNNSLKCFKYSQQGIIHHNLILEHKKL